jgi:hypothetical protein
MGLHICLQKLLFQKAKNVDSGSLFSNNHVSQKQDVYVKAEEVDQLIFLCHLIPVFQSNGLGYGEWCFRVF